MANTTNATSIAITSSTNLFDESLTETPRVTMPPTHSPSVPRYPQYYDEYEPDMAWNYTDVQPVPSRTEVTYSASANVSNIAMFIFIVCVLIAAVMIPFSVMLSLQRVRRRNQQRRTANHHEQDTEIAKKHHREQLHLPDGVGDYPTSYAVTYGAGDAGGAISGGFSGFDGGCSGGGGGGFDGGGACGM